MRIAIDIFVQIIEIFLFPKISEVDYVASLAITLKCSEEKSKRKYHSSSLPIIMKLAQVSSFNYFPLIPNMIDRDDLIDEHVVGTQYDE